MDTARLAKMASAGLLATSGTLLGLKLVEAARPAPTEKQQWFKVSTQGAIALLWTDRHPVYARVGSPVKIKFRRPPAPLCQGTRKYWSNLGEYPYYGWYPTVYEVPLEEYRGWYRLPTDYGEDVFVIADCSFQDGYIRCGSRSKWGYDKGDWPRDHPRVTLLHRSRQSWEWTRTKRRSFPRRGTTFS